MRTRLGLSILATLAIAATVGWTHSPRADIQGGWIVTSDDESHQRGLYIFTEANYSIMYVSSDEPRVDWSSPPTEAERLAAMSSIVANSGRYSMEGDQINFEAYMALAPNYMNGWPDNDRTATVSVDGDRMTWTYDGGDTVMLRKVGN